MPGSQKRVSEPVLDGANLFSFSQFSCEKLKRFAPSEAVPGVLDGVTTSLRGINLQAKRVKRFT
jgi:hypothetical protein